MSSRIPDHIALIIEDKVETGNSYVCKGRVMVNMDRYPHCENSMAIFRIEKTGGGSGWIKIYDVTSDATLLEQEITASSATNFAVDLTNCPETGIANFECQLKTDGTGEIKCYACSLEIL